MNITENLNSVYIQGFNDTFSFCSNNKIWKTDFYGNYLFNTFIKNTPNSINKDIDEYPNNYFYAIGGDKYSYSNIDNSTGSTYCDNFYKPLDANCIFYRNSIFVGTDHGIYKNGNNSNFANEYLEWMVSSQNFNISEFWGDRKSVV